MRVANDIEFDRDWVAVTFDDGRSVRTLGGADFEGPLATGARTERLVLPDNGQVSIRITIAPNGDRVGEADLSLELRPKQAWVVRIVLDDVDPTPCFGCVDSMEIPLEGAVLSVDRFWIVVVSGCIGTVEECGVV